MESNYKSIVPYLLTWYDCEARILPWRQEPSPYHVWISEIMLQQTRVEAVKAYYQRFIETLPDMKSLALVKEDHLMKLWEGLGYYSRARNLQKTAQILYQRNQTELPRDVKELLKLPGIGPYTAGAIASIAYQIPVPAVDGNVLRVIKRIEGSFDDITKQEVKKEVSEKLCSILPKDHPGDFNQSLMELGALICVPNGKPNCDRCPVSHLCQAFQKDLIMQIPVKTPKKKRKIEQKTVFLLEFEGKIAIRQRPKQGLLAGLWEFPNVEGHWNQKQVAQKFHKNQKIIKLNNGKHIFTHIEWHMYGYYIVLTEKLQTEEICWVTKKALQEQYALPTAFSTFLSQFYSLK